MESWVDWFVLIVIITIVVIVLFLFLFPFLVVISLLPLFVVWDGWLVDGGCIGTPNFLPFSLTCPPSLLFPFPPPPLPPLSERGSQYAKITENSFQKIASLTEKFVRHDGNILVHGGIAPVQALLLSLSFRKKFHVFVTSGVVGGEGGEEGGLGGGVGGKMCELLEGRGVGVTLIPDASVAYFMERVDMVLVGCEGVVENGGKSFFFGCLFNYLFVYLFG